MKGYEIQIKTRDWSVTNQIVFTWKPMRTSDGRVYLFDTWLEATEMANLCYPDKQHGGYVRVRLALTPYKREERA